MSARVELVKKTAQRHIMVGEGLTDQETLASLALAAGYFLEAVGRRLSPAERGALVGSFLHAVGDSILESDRQNKESGK